MNSFKRVRASLSNEHIENFTKAYVLELMRDLGNTEGQPCQPGSYEEALKVN